MRYGILAIMIVVALLAALILIPQCSEQTGTRQSLNSPTGEAEYEAIPAVERPDYGEVISDKQQRADLATQAQQFIDAVTKNPNAITAAPATQPGEPNNTAAANAAQTQPKPPVKLGRVLRSHQKVATGKAPTVQQLFDHYTIPMEKDELYYVHNVTKADEDGLWGVLRFTLSEWFARGVALQRGQKASTYQVLIPQNADRKNVAGGSSFLGKVIHYKTYEAWVFDRKTWTMTDNPNNIVPGKHAVIVSFTPKEMIGIYQYFVKHGEQP